MRRLLIAAAVTLALSACGLDVQAPDLFVATRVGGGPKLSMLVNYDGSFSCDGGKPRQLPDPLLLEARDLANALNGDAEANLHIPPGPSSVATYSVRVPNGTVTFPDTAGRTHPNLAQLELFMLQAGSLCG